MSFPIPTFVPKTVTDLTSQLNEESELSKREAALREQARCSLADDADSGRRVVQHTQQSEMQLYS